MSKKKVSKKVPAKRSKKPAAKAQKAFKTIKLTAVFTIGKGVTVTPIKKGKVVTALKLDNGMVATPAISFGIGPEGMTPPNIEETIKNMPGFAALPFAPPFAQKMGSITLS